MTQSDLSNINGNRSFSFSKSEKLTSKIIIDRLFREGKSIYKFPLRLLYITDPVYSAPYPQVMISVSKKIFKKAVDRNHVKRLIREAYRLQKNELVSLFPSPPAYIILIYTSRDKLSLEQLKKRLNLLIQSLSEETGGR